MALLDRIVVLSTLVAASMPCSAASVQVDLSDYRAGAVRVESADESLTVTWPDESSKTWKAVFSLDPDEPLITSVGLGGHTIVSAGRPFYRCETGKRRRGWNAFFDYPPSHPDGTRGFQGAFSLRSARVRSVGDRVELFFDGLRMGIFDGGIAYTIFPGSRLIQQEAVMTTYEADTAYYYDTGLEFASPNDERPGRNMQTETTYFDTNGKLRTDTANGTQPERVPLRVRYRTLAMKAGAGSLAVFPAPHQYFFPRDFTSNLGHLWHRSWRGRVSLGIRQIGDSNWRFYPWVNAPPGQAQRMGVFFLLSDSSSDQALKDVLRYTNRDRFPALDGYKTMSTHWHLAYTVQAVEKGFDWIPPFKPVLKDMGVDASIIMDFHGDGHPRDLTDLRLEELEAFFKACRAQSDPEFLLIPSEEANVHLGGHWSVFFPKPVYWFMNRPEGGKFQMDHPKYGRVYSTADEKEMLELVREEGGYMYQTHARTKGSTGYPDKIRHTEHFLDPRYLGAGWKAMPADHSTPRLGERVLNLLDDMNNWGLEKRVFGEVDVFQLDHTHELYAHMNINYIRLDQLPGFDNYGDAIKPLAEGDFFTTTGEVLLPQVAISTSSADEIAVKAQVQWTFPLRFAEIVWGDGEKTDRKIILLATTGSFGRSTFEWTAKAPGWKWARVAVWDVAANGAFVNPVRR